MTWPLSPESATDLPGYESPAFKAMVESLEVTTPGVSEQIARFSKMFNYQGAIETLCEGDSSKEQILGSLMVTLAYRVASATTPQELKDLRNDMFLYENGQDPDA